MRKQLTVNFILKGWPLVIDNPKPFMIRSCNNKIREIREDQDKEYYLEFLGYVSALYVLRLFDYEEMRRFKVKAYNAFKSSMASCSDKFPGYDYDEELQKYIDYEEDRISSEDIPF